MNKTTATVETLTAQVRVLMVGSRQVTLSVARQVDEVSSDSIKPFGRIRTNTKRSFAVEDSIEVIGCDEDGSLVRSKEELTTYRCGSRNYGGHVVYGSREAMERQCSNYPQCRGDHFWQAAGDRWEEWSELDLIVLAGLK